MDKENKMGVKEAESAPEPASGPPQMTLDAYCRSVAQSVPAETLSVFFTTETAGGRGRATFDEFAKRLQAFQNAPLG